MHISITKIQLVNFIFNNVNDEERSKIIAAISTDREIKERYLFEKRKYDVERYIYDEMTIGDRCEMEELIKMDSRLSDHFVRHTEANEVEQDETINDEDIHISKEEIVKFILNDVYDTEYIEEYYNISEAINTNPLTKEIYLFEKRKYDVDRYLDDKMDFGECCEMEELLKINLRLYEYFELKKGKIEEQENILINLLYPSVTRAQLVNFVFNDVNEKERNKIIEAISKNPEIKKRYLFEKRKHDVERYIDDEMTIGERCEIEKLIKTDSRLFNYFELNNGVMENEQTVSTNSEHIAITQKQLTNFVIYDVDVKEHKEIIEAIVTNPVVKERYLHEKRKHDVDRFIEGELDFGERCEIEELLKTNSKLFEYFKSKKGVNEFAINDFIENINNGHTINYDSIHNNESGKDKKVSLKETAPLIEMKLNVKNIGKWVAAASIIFIIGFGGRNIYLHNTVSLENRLYAKYHKPLFDKNKNFFISSSLLEAKDRYRNKEYDVALMLIENLPNSMTIESEKLLYRGLTLMELERFDEAINDFEQVNNNNNLAIKSVVNWNLALCYLKTGKQEKAIELFEKIIQRNYSRSTEAKKILLKISNS